MTLQSNQSKLDGENNNKLSIKGVIQDGSDRTCTTWGSSSSSFKSISNSSPTTSQNKHLMKMTVNPDEFDSGEPSNQHAQSPGHSEQEVAQSSGRLRNTRTSWSSTQNRHSITSVSTLLASNATNSLLEGGDEGGSEGENEIEPVPLAIVRTQFGIPASRKSSSSDTKTERHADGSTTTIVNADESLNAQGYRSSFPSRPKEIKPINPDQEEPEKELKDLVFSTQAEGSSGRNELDNSTSSIPNSIGSTGSSGKQAGTQSDDSYSFGLDASWCSTSLSINARALEADKMTNLEDIINGSTRSSEYGLDVAAPALSNRKSRLDGNSGIANSFNSIGSESFHLTESEHNLNLDIAPSPRPKDSLPRLFKTGSARGANSMSGIPRPVVFVDGGGSVNSEDCADVPSSTRRKLISLKRRGSDTTHGSGGRRGNAGLNNSITLTGLQVLTASMQAACRRPSSPDPQRDEEMRFQNGDQHSCSTIDDNNEFDEGNRMNSFNDGGINPSGEGATVSQVDDTELVAAAGGKAYLHASRSVWAMRIIVVATFLVVSVIVTTMTFVFFKTMETELIEAEFAQYSSSMAVSTVQILEKQALSLRGLGNMYTSIFGSEEVPPYNHPPSVILNPDGTTSDTGSNWKTSFPNVTIPGYNEIAANLIGIAELRSATFAPLLMYSETDAWEEYARNNALPRAAEVVQKGIRKATLGLSTTTPSFSVPTWQVAPAEVMTDGIMWDLYSHEPYRESIDHIATKYNKSGNFASTGLLPCGAALIPVHKLSSTKTGTDNDTRSSRSSSTSTNTKGWSLPANMDDACTAIFVPVYNVFPAASSVEADLSGFVTGIFSWTDILAIGGKRFVSDLRVVIRTEFLLSDGSYQSFVVTYNVNEDAATLLGTDAIVDPEHQDMVETFTFSFPGDTTKYSIDIHSTDELETHYGVSNKPVQLSVVAACFFILSTLVFFIYDYFVKYRQKIIERSAAHTTRIVHSLYPAFIRDSLFENAQSERKRNDGPVHAPSKSSLELKNYEEEDASNRGKINNSRQQSYRTKSLKMKVSDFVDTPTTQLRRFLNHPAPSREYDYNLNTPIIELDPIAEVFERTTVMFADIAGFTAWCSEREPSQVFRLLETVYREFDIEASKLGVFKVETVGDCYVAVTGLPDEREDHAITIAKYAVKCMLKFNVLTKSLEANLGPGTASLGMRFGLHSGPVTAGVLRGEKSRFQLFGDTMNVASRMESTGEKNRIQISQDTADLIITAGKGHWLTPREAPISAKGKGSIQTYWLKPGKKRRSSSVSYSGRRSETSAMSEESESNLPKSSFHHALQQSWKCIGIENNSRLVAKERLVRWNAAILESFLLKIVDNRNNFYPGSSLSNFTPSQEDKVLSFSEKLSESIMFPNMKYTENYRKVSSSMAISSVARAELIEYVARISSLYRDVPFHNFEHASHVTMSANKLLNKVCSSFVNEEEVSSTGYAVVTERTFGISADPLAQFVVVFSSLVHDVDHQGVPNAQLVKEEDPLAAQFQNRSVAEKRSITIAWDILMEDRYRELQSAIFVNGNEMVRFKQLLINTVLATDIADKERSAAGKIRWQKAFHPSKNPSDDNLDSSGNELDDVSLRSLKATLVFEQIMQASDVAHTMQHWETFRKWNRRLFQELSKAYREGRGATDPKEKWYENEIGFFDFYIIPLAKKLRECGVFGTAEREYLDYALENRRRWEEEGREIAKNMIIEYEAGTASATVSTAMGATGETQS